jgi:uncharacterized glyoxalase superfamily protein PhnB
MNIGPVTPLLRSFDATLARRFYLDYLGFELLFEHRFEPGLPLYMAVRRDGCELHLSEHHGDCTPGAALRIAVDDIDALHAELTSRPHPNARPSIEETPWGTRDMQITDPFGNRLTFTTAISL